jgi:hypothetical protein
MRQNDPGQTGNEIGDLIDVALAQKKQETTDTLTKLLEHVFNQEPKNFKDATKAIAVKVRRYRPHNQKRMNEAYEAAQTLRLKYWNIWRQPGSAKYISHETGISLSRVYRYFKLCP